MAAETAPFSHLWHWSGVESTLPDVFLPLGGAFVVSDSRSAHGWDGQSHILKCP